MIYFVKASAASLDSNPLKMIVKASAASLDSNFLKRIFILFSFSESVSEHAIHCGWSGAGAAEVAVIFISGAAADMFENLSSF
jgi:hypothetical protein